MADHPATGLFITFALGMLWLVLNVKLPSVGELGGSIDTLRARVDELGWLALLVMTVWSYRSLKGTAKGLPGAQLAAGPVDD
ncbi:hypothetical protein ACPCG0_00695 [Propionibacteriaceae bacterium Y1923]